MIVWDHNNGAVVAPKTIRGVSVCRGLRDGRRVGHLYTIDGIYIKMLGSDGDSTKSLMKTDVFQSREVPIHVAGKWYLPVFERTILRSEYPYTEVPFPIDHHKRSPYGQVPCVDRTYVSAAGKCAEPKEGQLPIYLVNMYLDGLWGIPDMDYADGALWAVDHSTLLRRDTRCGGIEAVSPAPSVNIYGADGGLLHAQSSLRTRDTQTYIYDICADRWNYGETLQGDVSVFLA